MSEVPLNGAMSVIRQRAVVEHSQKIATVPHLRILRKPGYDPTCSTLSTISAHERPVLCATLCALILWCSAVNISHHWQPSCTKGNSQTCSGALHYTHIAFHSRPTTKEIEREFIDYKTIMTTHQDLLWELLFC
jgi:hypothetical protein